MIKNALENIIIIKNWCKIGVEGHLHTQKPFKIKEI